MVLFKRHQSRTFTLIATDTKFLLRFRYKASFKEPIFVHRPRKIPSGEGLRSILKFHVYENKNNVLQASMLYDIYSGTNMCDITGTLLSIFSTWQFPFPWQFWKKSSVTQKKSSWHYNKVMRDKKYALTSEKVARDFGCHGLSNTFSFRKYNGELQILTQLIR